MNVHLSTHAVERYIERVKPTLSAKAAREEMHRLMQAAEIVPYIDYVEEREQFDAFMELAPGITLCLRHQNRDEILAVTTTIRTGAHPAAVRRKREEKRKRKRRAQAQKQREKIARKTGRARPEEK